MDFLQPGSWAEALQLKAERPEAVPIQGGTDVMVEMNFDVHRPDAILDLNPCREVFQVEEQADGRIRLGSGVPFVKIINRYQDRLPGLAQASRTVGSPQIRNRGTVGGNLGGASHSPL
ncbi:FAD binding domain-containing protein [Nocardia tengchongensis]|uniref:FAD binding domain-containing protein n=1 Tax=Nocardia tengchongensis TaxID=2055889 RepID=UPI00369DBA18